VSDTQLLALYSHFSESPHILFSGILQVVVFKNGKWSDGKCWGADAKL
jgi:hypothetical protein